ncbi:MAG: CoA ester lyase [Candidatus Cloacimonetes bacterium]|nr:CoA ester lyase [Candidatus Cloacimonadota bacterium]
MNKESIVLRSLLFVPGHNEKIIEKAAQTMADAIIFDLEDSVRPEKTKAFARILIQKKIKEISFRSPLLLVRVNDLDSGKLVNDLKMLCVKEISGFVFPKTKSKADIIELDKILTKIERDNGFEKNHFILIPLVETTGALIHLDSIIKASERIVAVAFGCEDYIADLQGIHDPEGISLLFPRSQIAACARSNNIIPIDTVHINVHDLTDLERNLRLAKTLGFEGMLCLHPKEIEIAHQYFSPSEAEIEDAKEMLDLARKAEKEGRGVALKNGKFIGPPMVKAAEKLLKKAEKIRKI